jgi:periplasmic copper chaperone A
MHRIAITTIVIAGFAAPLLAADMAKVGDIMIHEPWVRASLGAAPNSAAYMTLETVGSEPDRLVGGSSPAASKVEPHAHIMEGGVAKMRPVEAIEVAPGTPTVLEPGGLHLMLVGLTEKLEDGGTIPLTLVFETAGEITLEVPIKGMAAATGHGAMHHDAPRTN